MKPVKLRKVIEMNDRDKIIEKIKKLLALSKNNTSQEEAISASLKAQKLIADYDVKDSEINGSCKQQVVVTIESETYKGKQWRNSLAYVIAKNFRCRAYLSPIHHSKHNVTNRIKFVGYEYDAEAALLVYNKMTEIGESLAREACREYKSRYGTCAGVKNTFLIGFVSGIDFELTKQCEALMLVTPKEVEAVVANIGLTTSKFYIDRPVIDASEEGYDAGKNAIRKSRIEESHSHLLS